MARIFPLRSEAPAQEGQPRVVDLDDEDADAVFGALASTTARRIYSSVSDEPATPSDIAEAIDSSIQNVRYHLEKLEDAGLIEVVDTWYSSRGNEMSVYAPADGPLIVTSDPSAGERLRTALSRFVGGLGALVGGSFLVQYSLERFFGDSVTEESRSFGGDDAADADEDAEDADDDAQAATVEDDAATDGDRADDSEEEAAYDLEGDAAFFDVGPEAGDAALAVPPGLLFFLGGLLVLVVMSAYWYWSASYRI